jgi:hypothetical protein
MKIAILFTLLMAFGSLHAQDTYFDSTKKFISNYILHHEVVKGEDRKLLQFYEIDPAYRVRADVTFKHNSPWFRMESSGPMKMLYRVYAVASFKWNGKNVNLNIYQSQDLMTTGEYADYLFIPFTDSTTGTETYEGGRYIDLKMGDIRNGGIVIDFNEAYNPYCAYAVGYNCPIPPRENHLKFGVRAGEKKFSKD